ncbi:MAG: alpha/beta hydrolase [Haloechinothrix sp.]
MRKRLLIGVVVAGVLGSLLGAAYALQRSMIYFPTGGPLPSAAQVLPGGRDVTLTTSDGLALSAWFFPAARTDAPAVLFAPGNGGNRTMRVPLARDLTEHGLSVLLMDYRGYGGNPGSPTEEGLARDVRAAREYLVREVGVPPGRLLYFGESLGCGVVSELATEHPPAAMLLRSPFVDLASVASHHYPFLPARALLQDRFPVADNVRKLDNVPITVVWGSADTIVPAEQSRAVAEAAGAETVAVADADHNDAELLNGEEVVQATLALAHRAKD